MSHLELRLGGRPRLEVSWRKGWVRRGEGVTRQAARPAYTAARTQGPSRPSFSLPLSCARTLAALVIVPAVSIMSSTSTAT